MDTPSPREGCGEAALDQVLLPGDDVRRWMDERARRGWTETSRRLLRGLVLLGSDMSAGVLGVQIVLWTWPLVSAGGARPKPDYIPLLAMVFFLQPLALHAFRAYRGGRSRTDFTRIAAAITLAALLGWAQARLFGRADADLPNKTAYLYAALLTIPLAYWGRLIVDWLVRAGFRSGRLQRRLLVVGSVAEAEDLRVRCESVGAADIRIVGNVNPAAISLREEMLPVALAAVVHRTKASGVIIVSSVPIDTLNVFLQQCYQLGVAVSLLPRVLNSMSGSMFELRDTAAGALLSIAPLRLDLPQLAIKRTMDVVFTLAGLLVLWPVFVLVAVAVKLDSSGPVLFRQTRIGVGGRRFEILKFRTMVVGADAQKASLQHLNEYPDPRLFKIKDDPRITRLGRVLRKTSLDELPQLWNVLKGDMSLVGPRPCVPEELEHYASYHMDRLSVVPGVTGPWQVNGRNTITDFEQVVRLDREYVRTWSLLSDLVILARTIPTLFRRGAY